MPGTPRKRTTANRRTIRQIHEDVVDLDEKIQGHVIAPKPVKLRGKVYLVRRDLTGAEIKRYFELAEEQKDVEALALLVGSEHAEEVDGVLNDLPQVHMNLAVQEIMMAAGVAIRSIKAGFQPGESEAS